MNLRQLNHMPTHFLRDELQGCCGAKNWVNTMIAQHPYDSEGALHEISDKAWSRCSEADYKEAFTHHPKIGDIESIKKKFASTSHWSSGEQAGVDEADTELMEDLVQMNDKYEAKFGFIFIVCATGKTAPEMLEMVKERINNEAYEEIHIAAEEQRKIMHIRINKLLS